MSTKTPKSKVTVPDDPDPTPIASSDPSPEVASAARDAKKRTAKSYGRSQATIAGNTATADNSGKKTILGG